MVEFAKVEGDEIVIRLKTERLPSALSHLGFQVTEPEKFAPHMARELNAEGMDEDLFLNKVFDAAAIRAAECDAPGMRFNEDAE